jgi:hypothetical protein
VQVHENDRMVADLYHIAVRRKPDDNNSLYIPTTFPTSMNLSFLAPYGPIANPYGEPLNSSSASTEEQKIPNFGTQLSSPTPQPSAHPPIQGHDARSVDSPVSNIEGHQPNTTKEGDPNSEISARTALPPSEAQLTLPTFGDPIHSRKWSGSDNCAGSHVAKKQKTEPLPKSSEDLFYHKSGPKVQIRRRSDWLGMPSKRGQQRKRREVKQVKRKGKREGKRKGKRMSNEQLKGTVEATPPGLPYTDEVDKAYLDGVLKTLRSAPFLDEPQEIECTVGMDGSCDLDVVRPPRSTGIGQVQEGDSVYFIFLSQIEDKFLCWICGHTMTVEKQLRALRHVRMHFKHHHSTAIGE